MKKQISSILLFSAIAVGSANASVLTFDDLSGVAPVANGYGGFNWNASANGIYSIDKSYIPGSGYDNGTVSGNTSVFNAWGTSGNTIDLAGSGTFDFNGAYFTSAWDSQDISFQGWNDGSLLFSSTNFTIDTSTPLFIALNWMGIDRLTINNTGSQWDMDNFTFNEHVNAVPVPAAVWLFGSALTGLFGFGKRKQTKVLTA
jgi:hypothetical protein